MKKLFYLFSLLILFNACSDNDNPVVIPEPEIPVPSTTLRDGITILSDDSLGFVLFAPDKETVHLIGDFNNWQVSDKYKMNKSGDRFWIRIGDLQKGKEYICQYLIDGTIRVADPYASKISDPKNDMYIDPAIYPNLIAPTNMTLGISMVVNTAPEKYSWKVSDFRVDNPHSLNIYEVLIRDFTEERSIKAVKGKLDYIQNLGITAIELMPFNEFEGNDSWGYNPSFYFATDKAYGTSNDYKEFIDECHKRGIAVIMDMVLNHSYSQSPLVTMYQQPNGKVSENNPWYNVESPNTMFSWGYDFDHESVHTQALVDSVCAYWMKEYKVDGFRFDFTKGFTNTPGDGGAYDEARIKILKRMTDEIRKRNPDAIIIFEHLADNAEEKVLSDYGIYLWGNINYNFNELTMGWGAEPGDYGKLKGDISWASYQERGWSIPNLVAYMESHDEERIMFKNNQWGSEVNLPYNVKDLATGLKRNEAAAVILMSLPGPKMIWQFGELGYDFSINSAEDGSWDDSYGDQYRTGKKQIRWDYYDVAARRSLHDVYAKMNKLRTSNGIFSTADYTIGLGDNFKQVLLRSASGYVCAVANLDVKTVSASVKFDKPGVWEDYFSGETISVSNTEQTVVLNPGEYRLYFSK